MHIDRKWSYEPHSGSRPGLVRGENATILRLALTTVVVTAIFVGVVLAAGSAGLLPVSDEYGEMTQGAAPMLRVD